MFFSVAYFIIFFSVFLILLGFWLTRKPAPSPILAEFPKVSILIAARNEEENILRCLQAIDRLDYPKDKIEVLVGDDRSTDSTWALVEAYKKDKPYISCISIQENVFETRGKANVLAQLAHHATSDYYFITDADIEVPAHWLTNLLSYVEPGTGIVTGITTTTGNGWLARMQTLDWLFSLGLMQVLADRGLPVSTMGNNMMITRKAYEAVGGFEGIPFSITEDVQIFNEVRKKGFQTRNIYQPEVLALSQPAPTLGALVLQRRRWMRGSRHLPWYMWLLLVVYSMYYPVWLPFFLHTSVTTFGLVFLAKLLLQSLFVGRCLSLVNWKKDWKDVVLFEFYLLFTYLILIACFFWPGKIKWKGRAF